MVLLTNLTDFWKLNLITSTFVQNIMDKNEGRNSSYMSKLSFCKLCLISGQCFSAYTPRKRQKIRIFLTFSGGTEI